MRRALEVHPAQRAAGVVERQVSGDHARQAVGLEVVLTPRLYEETAFVRYALRDDLEHPVDVSRFKPHRLLTASLTAHAPGYDSTVARRLTDYAAYVFDMDGTLVLHDRAIPGAAEALRALKAAGKHVLTVTNNSSLGQHALAERFRRFGLPLEDHEVFSALVATARLVAHEKPGALVHVFGNPGLRSEIERCYARVVARPCDRARQRHAVRVERHGDELRRLSHAQHHGLGAHGHRPDGDLVPGCGVFAAALERAIGRPPDVVVGKPSITLLCEAAASVGEPPDQCLYIGDNPEADVGGAHAAGMDAMLVLSGVATSVDEALQPPEHVLPSVADLIKVFG